MKRIKQLLKQLPKLLLIMVFASCSNFLDVKPISEIPQDQMWLNQREVRAGINEMYSAFREALRTTYFSWGEMRADNFVVANEGLNTENERLVINQLTNDMAVTDWAGLYRVISHANYAIKYIPDAEIANDAEKNDYLAQAYAMRALAYFFAVRIWGDVPVYLEPIQSVDGGTFKGRTPMQEVLEEVIYPDLKQAEFLIDPLNVERKRISRAGIYAIQADVLMWMKEYEEADIVISKLNTLTTRWRFEPSMSQLKYMFHTDLNRKLGDDRPNNDEYGGPNELIFVIHFDLEESNPSQIYSLFSGTFLLSPKLRNRFLAASSASPRDTRFDNFLTSAPLAPGEYRLHKYGINGVTIPNTQFSDCEIAYPIYRFTDMVLLQAECLARMDKFQDALNLLSSTVRQRAGVASATRPVSSFASREALIDYILDERQMELVGEGKRWFDLVRTDRAVRTMQPINGMSNESHIRFPLNFNIMLRNPNISQNPGYN